MRMENRSWRIEKLLSVGVEGERCEQRKPSGAIVGRKPGARRVVGKKHCREGSYRSRTCWRGKNGVRDETLTLRRKEVAGGLRRKE